MTFHWVAHNAINSRDLNKIVSVQRRPLRKIEHLATAIAIPAHILGLHSARFLT